MKVEIELPDLGKRKRYDTENISYYHPKGCVEIKVLIVPDRSEQPEGWEYETDHKEPPTKGEWYWFDTQREVRRANSDFDEHNEYYILLDVRPTPPTGYEYAETVKRPPREGDTFVSLNGKVAVAKHDFLDFRKPNSRWILRKIQLDFPAELLPWKIAGIAWSGGTCFICNRPPSVKDVYWGYPISTQQCPWLTPPDTNELTWISHPDWEGE